MDSDKRERYGVSWEDAWQLLHEVESGAHIRVAVRLGPPRQGKNGKWFPPAVVVSIDETACVGHRPLARTCQVGGARGARTYPAALVRALHELAEALEERQETARQLAAF